MREEGLPEQLHAENEKQAASADRINVWSPELVAAKLDC
jgi:hypothetical protein